MVPMVFLASELELIYPYKHYVQSCTLGCYPFISVVMALLRVFLNASLETAVKMHL